MVVDACRLKVQGDVWAFSLDQNRGERLFSLISHMAAMPSTVYLTSGYKQFAIGINTRLKQVKIKVDASSVVSSHAE
jgi:hypothetical protein